MGYNQLNSDMDEMTNEARMSEEKAARAMVDAARLADELRCEQELSMALEKDKKNHERMQGLIDQLQGKVKSYKKQIEEAEEIAALNLAKYRKVAGALGDATAAADAAEQALAMRKARARSASCQ